MMHFNDIIPHEIQDTVMWMWIFNSFVSSLPEPNGGGMAYKFFYKFVNTLAANMDKLKTAKKAEVKIEVKEN